MKRLLVGIDGSDAASSALRWAADVAAALGAELVAVAAWSPDQAELPPEEFKDEHAERRANLQRAVQDASATAQLTRSDVVDGEALEVLLARAEHDDAGLIVVGQRGAGGFRDLPLGSVAIALAHHTTRPLAVIPNTASQRPHRIVLGVDGSDGARSAAEWCATLASQLGAAVSAVHVFTQEFELVPEQDRHSLYRYAHDELQTRWIAPLHEAGVVFDTQLVRDAHVADALSEAAQKAAAQLIVVGTHGLAPIVHIRLGGVAMRLLHATSLPLVLVPPQA